MYFYDLKLASVKGVGTQGWWPLDRIADPIGLATEVVGIEDRRSGSGRRVGAVVTARGGKRGCG